MGELLLCRQLYGDARGVVCARDEVLLPGGRCCWSSGEGRLMLGRSLIPGRGRGKEKDKGNLLSILALRFCFLSLFFYISVMLLDELVFVQAGRRGTKWVLCYGLSRSKINEDYGN